MKSIYLILLLCISCLIPFTAFSAQLPGQMAMVGEWHGNEVAAENGEQWLALLNTPTGPALQNVSLFVERVEDAVLDIPPAKTGKKVSVPADLEPLVLLRNLEQLSPGPVVAAELSNPELSTTEPATVLFNGMSYEIGFTCDEQYRGEELADCPLSISNSDQQQPLESYAIYKPCTVNASMGSDAFPRILWAGDLDRDGKLDLLIDLTTHYNVTAPTLLLSSAAGEGQLVMPVAAFRTTGC
jgi:hypothetical protein